MKIAKPMAPLTSATLPSAPRQAGPDAPVETPPQRQASWGPKGKATDGVDAELAARRELISGLNKSFKSWGDLPIDARDVKATLERHFGPLDSLTPEAAERAASVVETLHGRAALPHREPLRALEDQLSRRAERSPTAGWGPR